MLSQREKQNNYTTEIVFLSAASLNLSWTPIGNHMISSAIWEKSTQVNYLKANQIARAPRVSSMCSL